MNFQNQAKIKNWGLSNVDESELDFLLSRNITLDGVYLQVSHHLLKPNTALLEKANSLGMITLCYSPLAEGFLSSKESKLSKKDFRHHSPYFNSEKYADLKRTLLEKASTAHLSLSAYAYSDYLNSEFIDTIILGLRRLSHFDDLKSLM